MNPQLLRDLWSLVDRSQSSYLLTLDDNGLVHWLVEQFRLSQTINKVESDQLSLYIRSKVPLIRDLLIQSV
ncbi:MAG: hypothetical protein KGQ93_10100 [Cyanobacteria bacterium REEB459]|nr:hypothetical protein [Cyanobacteria bacterium REEB459]